MTRTTLGGPLVSATTSSRPAGRRSPTPWTTSSRKTVPLPPTYDPHATEAAWYPRWESAGYFQPRLTPGHEPYVIVIPPPNVTGILHMRSEERRAGKEGRS